MARQVLAIGVVALAAAALAGSAAADKPDRGPAPGGPLDFPAGMVCPFPVSGIPTENRQHLTAFANGIPITNVDPQLLISKGLTLYDGTVAAGGNRFESATIAKYEFKTGMGAIAYDTSGVEPALNLTLSGDVTWVGGWGINVRPGGKAQGTAATSKKLADLIKSTGEFTIEAWANNANVAQEDAFERFTRAAPSQWAL